MLAYILRRILYAIPILIGVNLITFVLFFMINGPDDMARAQLGAKQVTPQMIEAWKVEKGYDKPLFVNPKASGLEKVSDTLFVQESLKLFAFDFGFSDANWTMYSPRSVSITLIPASSRVSFRLISSETIDLPLVTRPAPARLHSWVIKWLASSPVRAQCTWPPFSNTFCSYISR